MKLLSLTLLCFASTAVAQEPLRELCAKHVGSDLDGDGTREIESLAWLGEAGALGDPIAMLLVEERLLATGDDREDLRPFLERWTKDLAAEGFHGVLVSAKLHASERHQDGRTLLALRRFLRDVHGEAKRLHSVVLVGRFPEALLVRTVNWRKRTPLTLKPTQRGPREWREPVDYLRTVPEIVAHTCDLVLADLDGNWERLYTEERERLSTLHAVFPQGVPAGGGITEHEERGTVTLEDFFHVNDGHLELREVVDEQGRTKALHVIPWDEAANGECTEGDRARANPLALPEIAVSRIDAHGVAESPRAEFRDGRGRPTAVNFEGEVPAWNVAPWASDPALERRLLREFFDRNHAYRTGKVAPSSRPASLAHDLRSGYQVLLHAKDSWKELDASPLDVHGRPNLVQAVAWFREPAILRTIRAHSDPWGSVFEGGEVTALEGAFDKGLWSWSVREKQLVPSLRSACTRGKLDFFLLRTLWENGFTGSSASFYLHTGCEAISPPGAERLPYSHPSYGRRNGAQSMLFYADGLALIGRAKVFYDEPAGFCPSLANGHTFGEAWRRTFEIESRANSHATVGGDIGRKRTYFWSLLGDATLRLL